MFTWNPFYNEVYQTFSQTGNAYNGKPDERIGLIVLKKVKSISI